MNAVLIILRSGADQVLIDGKDIANCITRIEISQEAHQRPEIRLTLDPAMVSLVAPEAQLSIDGLADVPERIAREAYALLRKRFEPAASQDPMPERSS